MENYSYQEYPEIPEEGKGQKTYRKPTILQVSFLFSLTLIIFLTTTNRIPIKNYFASAAFAEVFLVMLPPLIFLAVYRYKFKETLRLNNPGILNLLLTVGIMVFAMPVVGVLNLINLLLINAIFGKVDMPSVDIPSSVLGLLLGILVIGVSAGVCEEVLFRGVIQRGYERLGPTKAIILTAFLFGLMHQDFQRFLGTFLLGAIIGFLVYRTNSLFSGMVAHFTNNSIVVVLSVFLGWFSKLMEEHGGTKTNTNMQGDIGALFEGMPKEQILITVVVWVSMFVFFASILGLLVYIFIRRTAGQVQKEPQREGRLKLWGLLWTIPGIAAIAFLYFAQGLHLLGIHKEWVKVALEVFLGVEL